MRRQVRNAQSKIRRLQDKGITTLGKHNPIRDADIGRYNKAQLAAYSRQLSQFTDRKTKFVAGGGGQAIPETLYKRYSKLAAARQQEAKQFFNKIEDYTLPSQNTTVGHSSAISDMDRPELHNPSANPIRDLKPRSSKGFTSERAMEKYIKSLEKQNRSGYLKSQRKNGMDLIEASLKHHPDGAAVLKRIRGLNDQQFGILWTSRAYVDAVSLFYESEKDKLRDPGERAFSDEALDTASAVSFNEVSSMLNDAEDYGEPASKAQAARRKARSDEARKARRRKGRGR